MDKRHHNSSLLKPLRQPPLRHRGFDDRLRARILQQLDAEPARTAGRRRMPAFALMLAGFAAFLAVLFVRPEAAPEEGHQAQQLSTGSVEILQAGHQPDHVWADGLLIGLRDDGGAADGHGPRYRTLWLAPRDGGLALQSEGEGILIPFGMDFWLLREGEPGIGGGLRLSKISAASPRPGEFKLTDSGLQGEVPSERGKPDEFREKLVFAGQSFVVLAREDGDGTTHLLTNLSSLASGERRPLPLHRIAGPEADAAAEANWFIAREAGQWMVRAGQARHGLNDRAAVHDGLCMPWAAIVEAVPAARDAFCSPSGNWLAVLTADALVALPVDDAGKPGEPALEVALARQEQPVLAEWATGEYVDKWTAYLDSLFPMPDM